MGCGHVYSAYLDVDPGVAASALTIEACFNNDCARSPLAPGVQLELMGQ